MHKIHVTEGLVLGKRGISEASTLVVLLTRDLGLVKAVARSARVEHSKLRYGLELLTRGRFSLVQGKAQWRLVGVEQVSRECMAASPARMQLVGQVTRLLLRLVQGEEPSPALYATVEEGLRFLALAKTDEDAQAIECVLVLRILAQLGYLPQTNELTPFIQDSLFTLELAAAAAKSRARLVRAINESLQATGL